MRNKKKQEELLDEILGKIEELAPEQELILADKLQQWFLKRNLEQVTSVDFTGSILRRWKTLTESLELEELDPVIMQRVGLTCRDFLTKIEELNEELKKLKAEKEGFEKSKEEDDEEAPLTTMPDDPQMLLEQAYQDLQSVLITTRQAFAQAIFTEKQFEQQIKKNQEQVDVWNDRIKMAKSRADLDLVHQAESRKKQYQDAVEELSNQLNPVRKKMLELRERLTELETEAQKTYTKKQVLIARSNAADAIERSNKLFEKLGIENTDPLIDLIENKVSERELRAAQPGTKILTEEKTQEILLKSLKTIEQTTSVIERMEKLIVEREAAAYETKDKDGSVT